MAAEACAAASSVADMALNPSRANTVLTAGQSVLLKVRGDNLYEERVVLYPLFGEAYLMATPDSGIERIDLKVPPLVDYRILNERRELPADIDESECFMVNEVTADGFFTAYQLGRLIHRAMDMVGSALVYR